MKVHIVLWDDGRIIPKMAQWLVERNGWTISEQPRHDVDVNYYMPYLQMGRQPPIPDTLTAAWFTHYEEGSDWKIGTWDGAKNRVDLAILTASVYNHRFLNQMRATVTPGVDREFFSPMKTKQQYELPLLGISGQAQPRKGLDLIQALGTDGRYGISLTGQWPELWAHNNFAWEAMPSFYNTIDVYVCTSSIEGIPMPPLEAAACGTKLVIPHGVGMMDDLPEMPGIRHYRQGDYTDMTIAIDKVLSDDATPESIRSATAVYSIDSWCSSHEQAIGALIDANLRVQMP